MGVAAGAWVCRGGWFRFALEGCFLFGGLCRPQNLINASATLLGCLQFCLGSYCLATEEGVLARQKKWRQHAFSNTVSDLAGSAWVSGHGGGAYIAWDKRVLCGWAAWGCLS